MSALSGITVSPDLASTFAVAVQSNTVRFIKVSIQNESLVHDNSVPIRGSFEEDLGKLQDVDVLQDDSPAYILAKLDTPSDWIAISYVPDSAKVREKMLYASTRLSLLKSLGSTVFTDSIFATSKEDLTADAYTSHLRHVAAPHPLSNREQEMIELRAAERETASYDGSRARTSYVGAGVGFNWSEEAERAVKELGQGTGSSMVVFTVDTQNETLTVHSTEDVPIASLGSSLPPSEPCYALFSWLHSVGPDAKREIIFIYSCPSDSPIKNRMIYSSGSTATFQTAKDILTSLSPPVVVIPRKVETSDPTELDEEYLKAELGWADKSGNAPLAVAPRGFARPKGPPRRR